MEKNDVELSLGLSFGGRFGVDMRAFGDNVRIFELQGTWEDHSWKVKSVEGGFPTLVHDVYRAPLVAPDRNTSLPFELDERRQRLHAKIDKKMAARQRRRLREINLNFPPAVSDDGEEEEVKKTREKMPRVFTVGKNGRKLEGILFK